MLELNVGCEIGIEALPGLGGGGLAGGAAFAASDSVDS